MSIRLIYATADGKRHQIDGIWPSTSAAIEWAQEHQGAIAGIAKRI